MPYKRAEISDTRCEASDENNDARMDIAEGHNYSSVNNLETSTEISNTSNTLRPGGFDDGLHELRTKRGHKLRSFLRQTQGRMSNLMRRLCSPFRWQCTNVRDVADVDPNEHNSKAHCDTPKTAIHSPKVTNPGASQIGSRTVGLPQEQVQTRMLIPTAGHPLP